MAAFRWPWTPKKHEWEDADDEENNDPNRRRGSRAITPLKVSKSQAALKRPAAHGEKASTLRARAHASRIQAAADAAQAAAAAAAPLPAGGTVLPSPPDLHPTPPNDATPPPPTSLAEVLKAVHAVQTQITRGDADHEARHADLKRLLEGQISALAERTTVLEGLVKEQGEQLVAARAQIKELLEHADAQKRTSVQLQQDNDSLHQQLTTTRQAATNALQHTLEPQIEAVRNNVRVGPTDEVKADQAKLASFKAITDEQLKERVGGSFRVERHLGGGKASYKLIFDNLDDKRAALRFPNKDRLRREFGMSLQEELTVPELREKNKVWDCMVPLRNQLYREYGDQFSAGWQRAAIRIQDRTTYKSVLFTAGDLPTRAEGVLQDAYTKLCVQAALQLLTPRARQPSSAANSTPLGSPPRGAQQARPAGSPQRSAPDRDGEAGPSDQHMQEAAA